eukprot:TRINITY_DN4944_c0_g1_i2.p2 TRINITY_DN4944_c0_g1~~TRINITY_DN4944_c0_g1_i2.p2  ORF type:complete len:143 (-),score=2.83 TRINITY_DN4944_c0_g1_i2:129-557(-)
MFIFTFQHRFLFLVLFLLLIYFIGQKIKRNFDFGYRLQNKITEIVSGFVKGRVKFFNTNEYLMQRIKSPTSIHMYRGLKFLLVQSPLKNLSCESQLQGDSKGAFSKKRTGDPLWYLRVEQQKSSFQKLTTPHILHMLKTHVG